MDGRMASLEMATEGGQYLWRFGETGGSDSDLNSNRCQLAAARRAGWLPDAPIG